MAQNIIKSTKYPIEKNLPCVTAKHRTSNVKLKNRVILKTVVV